MGIALQYDGWPTFVTTEGKEYATEAVSTLFDRCEIVTASMVDDVIFRYSDKQRPECLRGGWRPGTRGKRWQTAPSAPQTGKPSTDVLSSVVR